MSWGVDAQIKTESVADVQAAMKKMLAGLERAQPEGIRYASGLLPDRATFIGLLQVDDGVDHPLPGLPEYQQLLEVIEGSRAEPANVQLWTVIGSYRWF